MPDLIADIAAVAAPIITVAVLWGKMSTRLDNVEDDLRTHARHHEDHFKHAQDDQAHWTERERDGLTDILDEMKEDIKEVLRRNGGPRQSR